MVDDIKRLAEHLRPWLSTNAVSEIERFLYFGEWECAFYALWCSVSDSGTSIQGDDYQRLLEVGHRLGFDPEVEYKNFPIRHT